VVVPRSRVFLGVGALFLTAYVGGLALHRMLWGRTAANGTWTFLALVGAALFLHEGLHGLGMVLGGAHLRDVRLGFGLRRGGAAYATTATPLAARDYRVACALPLLVLGVAPLVFGLVSGSHLATRLGGTMVALAGGDVAILISLRGVPPDAKVIDHQSEPGFHLLPK
jgi:hypothetical protein